MVTESVEAFVRKDVDLAESVIAYDDVVDDFFEKVKNDLIAMITQNPQDGEYALDLLMIAKYFERIGDHVFGISRYIHSILRVLRHVALRTARHFAGRWPKRCRIW